MSETLQAIAGTVTYNLSDDTNYAWVQKDADFGMPPIRRLTQQGPQQHGVTDLGYRLDARTLRLVLRLAGTSEADYYTKRKTLTGIFKPSDDPLKLKFTYDSGQTRQLDCHCTRGPAFGQEGRSRWAHEAAVELYAPDSPWYDPTQVTELFTLSIASALIFPITFPIMFGSGVVRSDLTITYGGDWLEYPQIKITGPAVAPTVRNTTTNEKLALTGGGGYTIAVGETVTFTLTPGNKRCENNSGANIMPYVSTDSHVTSFHLAPDPEAAGGSNVLRFEATGCTSDSGCQVLYYNRYIGL